MGLTSDMTRNNIEVVVNKAIKEQPLNNRPTVESYLYKTVPDKITYYNDILLFLTGRCDTCQPDVCTKLLTDLECASSGILGINKVSCGDRGDNFDELTAVRRSCSGRSSCNLKNTHITWSTCCNTTDSNRYVQFQCVSSKFDIQLFHLIFNLSTGGTDSIITMEAYNDI